MATQVKKDPILMRWTAGSSLLVFAVTTLFFALKATGAISGPAERSIYTGIMQQAAVFRTMDYLPWDQTAAIQSVDATEMSLRLTVRGYAPSEPYIRSGVCNYRKLRDLIETGSTVDVIYRPIPGNSAKVQVSITSCR